MPIEFQGPKPNNQKFTGHRLLCPIASLQALQALLWPFVFLPVWQGSQFCMVPKASLGCSDGFISCAMTPW